MNRNGHGFRNFVRKTLVFWIKGFPYDICENDRDSFAYFKIARAVLDIKTQDTEHVVHAYGNSLS